MNPVQEDLIDKNPTQEQTSGSNKKKIWICVLVCLLFVAILTTVLVIVFLNRPIKIEIVTVKIPENIKGVNAHFLPDGNIAYHYYLDNESDVYFATSDEDGNGFTNIWHGQWKELYHSNGIRIVPLHDNKRILIGDYILECEPKIYNATSANLIPIHYPDEFVNSSLTVSIWSEPYVSPDLKYIAWTMLDQRWGAVNFIGKLVREDAQYNIVDYKIISSLGFGTHDEKTGNLILPKVRGGEIKQFIKGGLGLSLAGAGDYGLARSIYQDLTSDTIENITNLDNYDETTIFSPDEKLGLTMTTRFSPNSNLEILGVFHAPHSVIVTSSLNRFTYSYAVTKVRTTRKGNIGPALIEIEKSMKDKDYKGFNLHTDDNYAFLSPLSWHPSNLKGLWNEKCKIENKTEYSRVQKVIIKNYKPGKTVETQSTPENIPYAIDSADYFKYTNGTLEGVLIGEKSGNITLMRNQMKSYAYYDHYSQDGKTFYNGTMQYTMTADRGARFQVNLKATGDVKGTADFRLVFTPDYNLKWDIDTDGKPMTYGYSEFDGKKIGVELYKE